MPLAEFLGLPPRVELISINARWPQSWAVLLCFRPSHLDAEGRSLGGLMATGLAPDLFEAVRLSLLALEALPPRQGALPSLDLGIDI